MEEKEFRNKITCFSFFFSILVIWAHSYNGELFLGKTHQGKTVLEAERFLGDVVGQMAVPGFFLLSAYLFYRNFHWRKLLCKWKSRAWSVLVPYFLWNGLYYLGYLIGSRLPLVSRAIGKGVIPFTFDALLDALLNYRYLHTFWYMHQLILLLLLAPLIYLLLKHFWSGLIVLLSLFIVIWTAWDLLPWLNEDALFYYGTGAFLALHGRQLEQEESAGHRIAGTGMIIMALVNLYLGRKYYSPGATVLGRLFLPLGLWGVIRADVLPLARPWMQCNFFLYAVHFAIIRLVNKTAAMFMPKLPAVPLGFYLFMPVIAAAASYGAAVVLKKRTPVLWSALNGGR